MQPGVSLTPEGDNPQALVLDQGGVHAGKPRLKEGDVPDSKIVQFPFLLDAPDDKSFGGEYVERRPELLKVLVRQIPYQGERLKILVHVSS
jgi:hypothetical protein